MASFEKVGKRWKAVIRRKGYPKKTRTFDTKREAGAWAAEFERSLAENMAADDLKSISLATMIKRYICEVTIHKKSAKSERLRLQRFIRDYPDIANKPVNEVTSIDVARWRDDRLKTVTGTSVNREWASLSTVYAHATRSWVLPIKANPFRSVERPKENKPRNITISAVESARITDAIGYIEGTSPKRPRDYTAWCFLFALETAMRAGEILKLQPGDIKGRIALLRDTKNGEDRRVPLSSAALDLLSLLPDGLPVPITSQSLDALFRRYRPAALAHIHFHDTRHTALTRLAKKIANPMDLAKISGHKDLKILLNTYYNPDDDHLVQLLD